MKRSWLALITCLLTMLVFTAKGSDSFVVEDIRVEGLQRITQGTVYNYLPIHVGETISTDKTGEILNALFETGFFQDIQLSRDNNTLVIQVVERPTIGKITLTGNKDIPSDALMESLKGAGIAEGYVFERSTLDQLTHDLERLYFSRGQYGVKIDTLIEPQKNNRVLIAITINEGQAARIKTINIVGNRRFPTNKLLSSFTLSPTNAISWVTRSDQYDKQKLGADLEGLRNFYLDRGFLNFKVLSTQVSITPDKQDIYITINIEEGVQFTLSGYDISGETKIPRVELEKHIYLEPGEVFSRAKVADIVKRMTERLGQEGYAFAKVNPVPEVNDALQTVGITFYVEPGNKIYVRKIRFEGNSKTRDEVIRRDLIQMERAPVNTAYVEASRARLNRTGYFSEVKVDMQPVAGVTDQVDIVYTVEEASAGQLGGGAGYSDVDGLIFNAQLSNRNVFGTGRNLDLNFNHSKSYMTYSFSYNNPYYTLDGVSRGFNAFYSKTDLGKTTNITNYTTDAFGANVSYSLPISPYDRFTFGYGFQSTKLITGDAVSLEIQDFEQRNGDTSNEVTIAAGWIHNTFDRFVFPENGLQQSAGITASVPGSHLEYFRLTYNAHYYKSLGKGFIFTALGTLGYGSGYWNTDELPFYKHFYCGGPRTVRGYKESSLGPVDSLGNPFGGNFMGTGTLGMVLPNFFAPETRSIRAVLFVDVGQVYDLENDKSLIDPDTSRNPDGFRFSTGISLTWMSPIAPLVFNAAIPLNRKEGDKTQNFSFTFGTVF